MTRSNQRRPRSRPGDNCQADSNHVYDGEEYEYELYGGYGDLNDQNMMMVMIMTEAMMMVTV